MSKKLPTQEEVNEKQVEINAAAEKRVADLTEKLNKGLASYVGQSNAGQEIRAAAKSIVGSDCVVSINRDGSISVEAEGRRYIVK